MSHFLDRLTHFSLACGRNSASTRSASVSGERMNMLATSTSP